MPVNHFTLDLEADHQKEDRHHGVVDPVLDRKGPQMEMQYMEIGIRDRGIRHHQGGDGRGDQKQATCGSAVEKIADSILMRPAMGNSPVRNG